MKFCEMKFTPSSVQHEKDSSQKETTLFVRDESDNKLFTDIQVKDIRDIITEDCIGGYDADTLVWKACANMENKFIIIKHKTEGFEEELPNISTFKGLGNTVKETSWLGTKNLDRQLQGLPEWSVDDFEITECQRLKMDRDKAIEQAKIQIHMKMKQVRQQFRIPRIKLILGEGDNFRNKLDTCHPYKGQRKPTARPLILKEVRKWAIEELSAELAKSRWDGQMVEADDTCEYLGALGYQHYRRTGKFNYLVIASDKDAKGNPKLLVDPDTYSGENNPLRGQFKFPQAMLIEATDRSAGDLELVVKKSGTDVKGYGFKFIMYQAALGQDQADNYNALSHLEQQLDFGDRSAYKVLKPCKTAKEALQATIDTFAALLPYGVQYQTHSGVELDVPTIEYMNTYFKVAYMLRSSNDQMDFYKLCKAFKVDTSKIENNNLYTAPQRVFVGDENHIKDLAKLIESIVKEDMKGLKSKKKADQAIILDTIKEKLESVDFESHYQMRQFEKSSGKVVPVKQEVDTRIL